MLFVVGVVVDVAVVVAVVVVVGVLPLFFLFFSFNRPKWGLLSMQRETRSVFLLFILSSTNKKEPWRHDDFMYLELLFSAITGKKQQQKVAKSLIGANH